MSRPKAVIIGAGFGGLATANLLAKAGWEVAVYEQQAHAGGRAGTMELNGFRYDTGPSWYLMPEVYEHYFQLLGIDINSRLKLRRLDPAYKVFFEYAPPVTVTGDVAATLKTFNDLQAGSDKALTAYLRSAEQVCQLAIKYFLYNPFTNLRTLLQPDVLRHSFRLVRLLTTSLHRYVHRSFKSLPLQQILEYPAVFLGTSPFKTPAMYHLMSHLDVQQGVFYSQGGIYELVKLLVRVGDSLRVSYHYNTPVTAITTTGNRATGIELEDGRQIKADLVISNADLHFTETQLLPSAAQTYPETSWRMRTSGPSALLMYIGVKGKLPELEHHNLLFVQDWQQNFAAIYKGKSWPDKPSIYISKPSASDDTVAPKGYENIFVLVPLPAGVMKTTSQTETYADKCLDFIAKHCGVADLRQRIVSRTLYGPGDFQSGLNSWQGSALGLGHTLKQSALFRPAGQSRKLRNLYYVGGDVQPGIGLPMCLISAEILYKRLTGDNSAGPLDSLEIPKAGWRV